MIKNLYAQSLSRVQGRDVESEWFEIKTGVRQGDVLPPLLFIFFMNSCARDRGVTESSVETLMYTDDVAAIVLKNYKFQQKSHDEKDCSSLTYHKTFETFLWGIQDEKYKKNYH